MNYSGKRFGFTLLEVLLVVAAIGILAAIIAVAINPIRQLGKVRDAERQSEVSTLKNAIEQYTINNNGNFPEDIKENKYTEICDISANGIDATDCEDKGYVNLKNLVPDQLVSIPRDPQADNDDAETGYEVTEDGEGNVFVKAPQTEVNDIQRTGKTKVGYKLTNASYDEVNFLFGVGNTENMVFNSDGKKMFLLSKSNSIVYGYDLSTAYDVSTARYNGTSLDLNGTVFSVETIIFNSTGTKLFVLGSSNNSVYRYNLGTAYDLSTADSSNVTRTHPKKFLRRIKTDAS